MKTFKYFGFFLVTLFLVSACTEEDVDEVLNIDHTGGLLEITSTNISYIVGDNATYSVKFTAFHGDDPIQKIEVYNKYSTNTGENSNTVLLKTIDVTPSGYKESLNFSVTYEELIQGIIFDGAPLSDDDSGLNIGDGFTLTYKAYTASGDVSSSRGTTQIKVATRFAGTYRVIDSNYYRIYAFSSTWTGDLRIIESVDASIYKKAGVGPWNTDTVISGFGYAAEEGEMYFTVESDDTVNFDGVGNSTFLQQPYITCGSNPAEFAPTLSFVPCNPSNFVIRDDVDGRDIIYMTYGYLASSGPRVFYEVLEKVVD